MVKDKIKPLEHLQPKLIAGALYIHNGKDIQDKIDRTHQVQRIVGDKLATYVMALLVLPQRSYIWIIRFRASFVFLCFEFLIYKHYSSIFNTSPNIPDISAITLEKTISACIYSAAIGSFNKIPYSS